MCRDGTNSPRHHGQRRAWLGLAVALMLNGCLEVRASDLAGSEWQVETLDGIEVPADAEVFVRIEIARLHQTGSD